MKLTHCCLKSLLLVAFALPIAGSATADDTSLPTFSWDRVPVYLHLGSNTQLSNEQIETIARLSDFICLEKAHGRVTDPSHPERVAGKDARRIKTANPDAKVLMYWNTLIAWPFTSYNQNFAKSHPKDWILRDRVSGEPLLKTTLGKKPVYQYNLLNPELRKWWSDTVATAVHEHGFDGFFMDAVSQSKRPLWLRRGWGIDKSDDLDAATTELMETVKSAMGADHLLIYNGFRAHSGGPDNSSRAGTEFLPHSDGAQIEHFDQFSSTAKEDIVAYWQMANAAAKQGKIVLYKGWPDHDVNWLNRSFMSKPAREKETIARESITFPLACYLIGACENSYFCYGWGYGVDDGQLIEYPEYQKSLGAPKQIARRNGWVFRRQFAHADVTAVLENRTASIRWHND
ncbi:putative glycoside hydrolase [Rhodopirellula sallentina]|uniref:Putative secreted protein n=1 Tax=Rhodopirellula sallentina SM41 TaxID=1263870 RepID=M5TZG2_9BACT|nr:putative glycoside hydrolase [Rhodopirellula sallentina]EMI54590.1 putative secreted protein [Rhodopirellula sallentina SM41]